jgi:hypothetical protein
MAFIHRPHPQYVIPWGVFVTMTVLEHSTYEYWLSKLHEHISPSFTRTEPRQRAWTYMRGLAGVYGHSAAGRKHIASYASERRADGAQRLLTTAHWDETEVRKALRDLVKLLLGPSGGGLFVTEATFVKKGSQAVAVERQFSVENGRLENCQVAILLLYATPDGGLVLIDAELFVPRSWARDAPRRLRASIPDEMRFRPKSEIAAGMVERAVAAGLRPEWAAVSLLCLDKDLLRNTLRELAVPYLMSLTAGEFEAAAGAHTGCANAARDLLIVDGGCERDEQHCREFYAAYPRTGRPGPAYFCAATQGDDISFAELPQMISELNRMEEHWQRTRTEIRFDRYEVRSWHGWHRHMTLAMVAHTAMELTRRAESDHEMHGPE